METVQWRDYLGNALRYWEPRRILYNLLLACIVVFHFVRELPGARSLRVGLGILSITNSSARRIQSPPSIPPSPASINLPILACPTACSFQLPTPHFLFRAA